MSIPAIIDPEFKAICQPLTSEEAMGLQESILAEGCRDPLIAWDNGSTPILLDGHHRLSICMAHKVSYRTEYVTLPSRDDAIIWIIRNQLARRNLPPYARTQLVLKLEPLIAAKAKEKQREAGGALPTNSAKARVDTRDSIARAAHVSNQTVDRVKALEAHASADIKLKLAKGETTINREYEKLNPKPKKPRAKSKKKSEIVALLDKIEKMVSKPAQRVSMIELRQLVAKLRLLIEKLI